MYKIQLSSGFNYTNPSQEKIHLTTTYINIYISNDRKTQKR
jgi:hypothetical protein